jgi:hypothetical protein
MIFTFAFRAVNSANRYVVRTCEGVVVRHLNGVIGAHRFAAVVAHQDGTAGTFFFASFGASHLHDSPGLS